ncbi:MAG TPA: right-handed parallel beta-helix repeat-containing protein [Candidatus Babeliales bacterium]|nr:right-handed parallel beta-helix repeat-containing protein [Candidatus Babeliales bacterium]
MNYKSMLLTGAVLFFHLVNATGNVSNKGVDASRASNGKGLSCIQDTLCALVEKVDNLASCEDNTCAATVITEAQLLSDSGIYCLGNDVTGTIIITGSSITLNLNGHVVLSGSDGIAVASTASDVRIKNGFVRGSGADRGIFINGATDVRIEDVTCENWENGIYALDAFTVTLDRVMCNENEVGVLFENSTAAVVRNSAFNDNLLGTLSINGSIVEFINCSALGEIASDCLRQRAVVDQSALNRFGGKNAMRACTQNNETIGFGCGDATALYRDCSAFNLFFGFMAEGGQTDTFNSVAQGSFIGFALFGDRHTLTNCLAENNFEAGFASETFQGSGEVIFRECVAKGNFGYGFLETDVVTDNVSNMYLNCVACNNGTNYSPNILGANNAPVTTPTAARGFDNIDCDLKEPATCAAKMVSEPQTLTEPGVYCLTNDISGTIVIEGSGITLDLNGYTVFAQLLKAGNNNGINISDVDEVRIKNGRVQGADNFNSSGIFVTNSSNVRIEDVTCEGWTIGTEMECSSEVVLDRVFSSYNDNGATCNHVTGLVIRDSIFDYNSDNGVYLNGGSQGEIVRCTGTGNNDFPITDLVTLGATTFHVDESQVILRDCSASGYVIGFSVTGCRCSVDLYNCVAEQNYEGFVLDGLRACATNCASNNNVFSGFFMPVDCEGGFVTLRDCSAISNSSFGFVDSTVPTDTSVNMYLNCVACLNGINYSPNIILANNAPVTSAANARGFDNIDCSDTTPDLLAAVIQLLLTS